VARILRFLAEKGPASRYQIREGANAGSQPTVLSVVKELEAQQALIAQGARSKTGRGPKPAKYYDLSFYGLIWLLSTLEKEDKENVMLVRRVAKRFGGLLPEPLLIWNHFIEANVEDLAAERLITRCKEVIDLFGGHYFLVQDGKRVPPHVAVKVFLDAWVIDFVDSNAIIGDVSSCARWRRAVINHPVLRNRALDVLWRKSRRFVESMNSDLEAFGSDNLRVDIGYEIGQLKVWDAMLHVLGVQKTEASRFVELLREGQAPKVHHDAKA
jgi:hypothetical protein